MGIACLHVCVPLHVWCLRTVLDALAQELQTAVRQHVGTGNRIGVTTVPSLFRCIFYAIRILAFISLFNIIRSLFLAASPSKPSAQERWSICNPFAVELMLEWWGSYNSYAVELVPNSGSALQKWVCLYTCRCIFPHKFSKDIQSCYLIPGQFCFSPQMDLMFGW